MTTELICVQTTTPDFTTAQALSQSLVSQKLAACVHILPNITSVYAWQGKIEFSQEYLLIMKTQITIFGQICDHIKQNHPYECPEIISWRLADGEVNYLNWLLQNTTRS